MPRTPCSELRGSSSIQSMSGARGTRRTSPWSRWTGRSSSWRGRWGPSASPGRASGTATPRPRCLAGGCSTRRTWTPCGSPAASQTGSARRSSSRVGDGFCTKVKWWLWTRTGDVSLIVLRWLKSEIENIKFKFHVFCVSSQCRKLHSSVPDSRKTTSLIIDPDSGNRTLCPASETSTGDSSWCATCRWWWWCSREMSLYNVTEGRGRGKESLDIVTRSWRGFQITTLTTRPTLRTMWVRRELGASVTRSALHLDLQLWQTSYSRWAQDFSSRTRHKSVP